MTSQQLKALLVINSTAAAEALLRDLPWCGLGVRAELRLLVAPTLTEVRFTDVSRPHFDARPFASSYAASGYQLGLELRAAILKRLPHTSVELHTAPITAGMILAEARAFCADLLLLPSEGLEIDELLEPEVLTGTGLSVRVVRLDPRRGEPLRLLAAVGPLSDPDVIARRLLARRWPRFSELTLIHVLNPLFESPFNTRWLADGGTFRARLAAESVLEQTADKLSERFSHVHWKVASGPAAETIARYSAAKKIHTIFIQALAEPDPYTGMNAGAILRRIAYDAEATVEIVAGAPVKGTTLASPLTHVTHFQSYTAFN